MNKLKEKSKLKLDPDFKLDRTQLKSGFMGLYLNSPRINPQLFLRLALTHLYPEQMNDPKFAKAHRAKAKGVLSMMTNNVTGMLQVKKNANDFEVQLPILNYGTPEDLARQLGQFTPVKKAKDSMDSEEPESEEDDLDSVPGLIDEDEQTEDDGEDSNAWPVVDIKYGILKAENAINLVGTHMPAPAKACLQECFQGVRYVERGTGGVVFLKFILSRAECEYITNTAWNLIRPQDLYVVLQSWAVNYYGAYKKSKPPKSAFAISSIAKTLPKDLTSVTVKANDKGISTDARGRPIYLPLVLDQTQRYEDLFGQAGNQDDTGVFRLVDEKAPSFSANLPSNIPVLMDWVNCKFAYTNASGILTVTDVSRNMISTATHIKNWLSRKVDVKLLTILTRIAQAAGIEPQLHLKSSDNWITREGEQIWLNDQAEGLVSQYLSNTQPEAYFAGARELFLRFTENKDVTWFDLAYNSDFAPFRPLGRWFQKAGAAVLERMDNVYERYSVHYVTQHVAWLFMMYFYAHQYYEIEGQDAELRGAAKNQGFKEDWEAPALPLIDGEVVIRLPHQQKVANLLRDSPNFAILPVDAGGGKSMLAITDILQEFSKGRSAPYLIGCPGHLVAQYVKELVFFTKSRLNVIPITTYVIRKHGFERLTSMLASAPRNTVVIFDYNVLKLQGVSVCYGTTAVAVYPVAEMLKQMAFQYVLLDEAHYLRKDSQRTRSVMNLVADIPKKRLASGTMAYDSTSDLAMQIAIMDPTIFGTRDEFNERFAAEDGVKNGRVVEWRPGAQQEIMALIKSTVVVAGAKRKEWAALLPPKDEELIPVALTPEQQRVYQMIMSEAEEEIRANKELMAKIAELQNTDENELEDDPDAGNTVEALIRPYLQRADKFVMAPARDPLGNLELKGADRKSPKILKIEERIREHIAIGAKGKILIFASYNETADEIYESIAPDLQARGLLYKAADKVEAQASFETDDNLLWMVGVEDSINTGLNLQFCSRLIRVSFPWTPGALEQGNARLNRPNLKIDEERDTIYYDTILADKTIDIAKASRLISKLISVTKFENADSPAYEEIPDLPVIKMSLDNILGLNSWNDNLMEYAEAYRTYQEVIEADYAAYREDFEAKYGHNFKIPIKEAAPPGDAALMKYTPYVPGLELYGQGQLGLVRLDLYLRSDTLGDDLANETDVESEGKVDMTSKDAQKDVAAFLKGQRVHTEFGEGEVTSVNFAIGTVLVMYDDGSQARLKFSTVFVINRELTSGEDIRRQILKAQGQMPVSDPVLVPSNSFQMTAKGKKLAEKKKAEEEAQREAEKTALQESLNAHLVLLITNGFLGLSFDSSMEGSEATTRALEAVGFRTIEPYFYAHMETPLRLKKQITKWNEAGFVPDPLMTNEMQALLGIYNLMKEGKMGRSSLTFKLANRNQLRNFYRMEHKPSTDTKVIKPYPILENGEVYLALPIRGQVGTLKAIKVRAPGVTWYKSDPTMCYYALTKEKLLAMMKKIQQAGVVITNLEELQREVKRLKVNQVRDAGALEI
ncbi:helicase [Achromobacter phage Motura]|uniref:Helicase n=1 Tax=Achromobacter phage Motura TaxID=2591403 RepID=A0A514CT10_9CAUD|nr:DNA helicase [Achromobacter phage Motura]QDH83606.1 helicase [Achromobacter phage Motura]